MAIVQLSDQAFKQEVLESPQLAVVDFWAPWCAPCRMIAPVLEQLSEEYKDRLKICKINIDENQTIAEKFQILSIPTLLFFKNGRVVNQLVGVRSAADIKKNIEPLL